MANAEIQNLPPEVLAAMQSAQEPELPLDDDTPAPAVKPKRSRAKAAQKAKGKAGPNPAATLLAAMKFVSVAQTKNGTVQQTFSNLSFNWAAATNGIITAGARIEEDLQACPQTALFIDALNRVETEMTITQLSESYLSVSAGDLRAVIPCAPPAQVEIPAPDEPIATIDDRLKEAFAAVLKIPNEQSPRAEYAGALLQSGSVVATNGAVIFEYWHGIDLPPNLIVPKAFIQAVIKAGKPLARFGFSPSSVTFWFEDQSFIKTQTFAAEYPAYEHVISGGGLNFWPVPPMLFKAVEAVANFSENGNVFFKEGQIVSSPKEETPSLFRIEGLPEGVGFNGKLLLMLADKAERIAFDSPENSVPRVVFVGTNIRGAIAGLSNERPAVYDTDEDSGGRSSHGGDHEAPGRHPVNCRCDDCEIPF